MKILVTGGAGFIGNALVKRLVAERHTVRVMDDYSRGIPERLKDLEGKIEMLQGDVREFDQVDRATEGMEVVFHLAAVNGTENFYNNPDRVLEVGVKGTLCTMDAALKHGCKKYFLASSSEVYQEPTHVPTTEEERIIIPDVKNPRFSYSGGKIIGELLAIHYAMPRGLNIIIFRPHNIYSADMGNEHVVPQFIKRLNDLMNEGATSLIPFPIQGDGSQTRAFCYISDAIDGLMAMLEKGEPGEIYHLGNDEEVTIADLAHKIAAAMGMEITLQPQEAPAGGTPRRCPDITRLRALGYEPKVSLEEGLEMACKEELQRLQESGTTSQEPGTPAP